MSASSVASRPSGRAVNSRLTTILVIVVTAVVIGAVAYVIDQPTAGAGSSTALDAAGGTPPQAGQRPPDFQATTTDGQSVKLSDYAGKPVWLTFGASWCGDCRAEAPDLQAAYAKYEAQGLVVLGVFIDEDATSVKDYAGRVGFTFPMVADPTDSIADRYHILGIPTHFFIGPDGVIRQVRLGGLGPDDMDRLVSQILG